MSPSRPPISRLLPFLILALLLFPVPPAFSLEGVKASAGIEGGYRVDSLDWNIGGNLTPGNFVNVLSELTWDDLEIFQIRGQGRLTVGEGATRGYARGEIGCGWIIDGEVRDSDYAGSDRTLEFSRSNNSADDGDVFDTSIGGGLQWRSASGRARVAPLIGFSYHEQNLTLNDGVQTVAVPGVFTLPPLGPFPGLDSSYDAQWWGPWFGVDVEYDLGDRLLLTATIEYHRVDYEAEAQWNLRSDLAQPTSFEHEAQGGEGVTLALAAEYFYADNWSARAIFDYSDWKVEEGIDRVFSAAGGVSQARLNEVNWETLAFGLGIVYHFP